MVLEPLETQEEEVLALRHWWEENRAFIVGGTLALFVGAGGWTFWQDWSEDQRLAASLAWSELSAKVTEVDVDIIDSEERTELVTQAEAVASMSGAGLYGDYARLLLVRLALEAGDKSAARTHLDAMSGGVWPLASAEQQVMRHFADMLLARLDLAEGNAEQALQRLQSLDSDGPEVNDLRGDILLAQGEREQAVAAWKLVLEGQNQNLASVARLKLAQVETVPSFLDESEPMTDETDMDEAGAMEAEHEPGSDATPMQTDGDGMDSGDSDDSDAEGAEDAASADGNGE